MNDVITNLEKEHPELIGKFLKELSLARSRGNMPGLMLNGYVLCFIFHIFFSSKIDTFIFLLFNLQLIISDTLKPFEACGKGHFSISVISITNRF